MPWITHLVILPRCTSRTEMQIHLPLRPWDGQNYKLARGTRTTLTDLIKCPYSLFNCILLPLWSCYFLDYTAVCYTRGIREKAVLSVGPKGLVKIDSIDASPAVSANKKDYGLRNIPCCHLPSPPTVWLSRLESVPGRITISEQLPPRHHDRGRLQDRCC
jgi:hypothetical protein